MGIMEEAKAPIMEEAEAEIMEEDETGIMEEDQVQSRRKLTQESWRKPKGNN